uniref:SAP domain-containing protein n=1 Tax=Pithovirus LCPAC304 TaxID=2506594 RepID=A0A481ZCG3_9VIRU|nr:MAG: hypothetical protein LCPAC304_06980 [Pithovirus LCPAC304]
MQIIVRRTDIVKGAPPNAPLFPTENLLRNNFFEKDFLETLHIGKLRTLARENGVSATGKKGVVIRRLLGPEKVVVPKVESRPNLVNTGNRQWDRQYKRVLLGQRDYYWSKRIKGRLYVDQKYRTYFMRWNNPPKNWLQQILASCPEKYGMQLKRDTIRSGSILYVHAVIMFKNRRYPGPLLKAWKGAYLEKCYAIRQAFLHCTKKSTRVGDKVYTKGWNFKRDPFDIRHEKTLKKAGLTSQ